MIGFFYLYESFLNMYQHILYSKKIKPKYRSKDRLNGLDQEFCWSKWFWLLVSDFINFIAWHLALKINRFSKIIFVPSLNGWMTVVAVVVIFPLWIFKDIEKIKRQTALFWHRYYARTLSIFLFDKLKTIDSIDEYSSIFSFHFWFFFSRINTRTSHTNESKPRP